jgi:hypothetical protein
LLLYFNAIRQGTLNDLVQASVIGNPKDFHIESLKNISSTCIFIHSLNLPFAYIYSGTLLAMMLLLPGVSMVAGGLKYKEQHFNPAAAGVTSVLLLISVIGKKNRIEISENL